MLEKIKETADFLASRITEKPRIGMITGTGLGSITEGMSIELRMPYEEIPHFPRSTVEGHRGNLACGKFGHKPIIVMEGRFHIYEGYTPKEITFPIWVMTMLGIEYLFISSAAGGLNPQFDTGDLMVVTDHINLTGKNPLVGQNLDAFGTQFPDMSQVYDADLISLARKNAVKSGVLIRQGIYAGLVGPSFETPAETRFLRLIGADAVGMSTVSEAIVAMHCGLKVMAIVVITNMNLPDCMEKTSTDEVIEVAQQGGSMLGILWEGIAGKLPFSTST